MNKKDVLIRYALQAGRQVDIDEVQSGLAGGYVCIECGRALVARKGEKKANHFAHLDATNCTGSFESRLHKDAKAIIAQELNILTPPLETAEKRIIPTRIYFDSVEEEVWIYGIRPDLIAKVNGRLLAIEIAVTHFVSADKKSVFEQSKLAAMEIDLSSLRANYAKDKLRDLLINNTFNKSWLYNTKQITQRRSIRVPFPNDYPNSYRLPQEEQSKTDPLETNISQMLKRAEKAKAIIDTGEGYSSDKFDRIQVEQGQVLCFLKMAVTVQGFCDGLPKRFVKEKKLWDGSVEKINIDPPTIRLDGETVKLDGYDENSSLLFVENERKVTDQKEELIVLSMNSRVPAEMCATCEFNMSSSSAEKINCTARFEFRFPLYDD
jgi:hypothetical protein